MPARSAHTTKTPRFLQDLDRAFDGLSGDAASLRQTVKRQFPFFSQNFKQSNADASMRLIRLTIRLIRLNHGRDLLALIDIHAHGIRPDDEFRLKSRPQTRDRADQSSVGVFVGVIARGDDDHAERWRRHLRRVKDLRERGKSRLAFLN